MAKKKPSTTPPGNEIDPWAEHEFGHVPFTDKRLEKRVKKIATNFARLPTGSIPQASGNWANSKAAYRLFDNEAVSDEEILENHLLATVERTRAETIVFAIQDTSSLNYTPHPATTGLGPINNNADKTKGLFAHTTLIVTPSGVPMGILDEQIQARDEAKYGDSKKRNSKPIEEKESVRWLDSFRTTEQLADMLPETQVVVIADREADIYELLVEAAENQNRLGLLVRAQHDRGVAHEEKRLWKALHSQPESAKIAVEIPGGNGRKPRTAILSIRFCPVTVKAPLLKKEQAPVSLWAVEALEENAPSGVSALCWKLLTTVAVATAKDAIERVQWYKQRWLIELFHKILKSGCKIEARQLQTAERLKKCAAIDLVVAWRILYLTTLSRYTPNAPSSGFLAEHEWKALYCYIHRTNQPPAKAPDLRQAVRWIAQLGGFLGRKGDGDPGPITLWRGIRRLEDIAAAYLVFNPSTCG